MVNWTGFQKFGTFSQSNKDLLFPFGVYFVQILDMSLQFDEENS